MPKLQQDVPETLQPYIALGLDLTWRDGDKDAHADCPWCGREGKFNVLIETGVWRCVVCAEGNDKGGGNATVFVRKLWDMSHAATQSEEYKLLADDRRLANWDTLMELGVARSILNHNWLIPAGYNSEGKLRTLYQYVSSTKRSYLLPTKTLGHHLFGTPMRTAERVYVVEGFWDMAALWEVLKSTKLLDNGRLRETGNLAASLLADAAVVAVPGNMVFSESWAELFQGKDVVLLGQNDHRRVHPETGAVIPPASYVGMMRLSNILSESKTPPRSLSYLPYGPEGFDPSLPTGYDVRDELTAGWADSGPPPIGHRIERLRGLLERIKPVPSDWLTGELDRAPTASGGGSMECLYCDNYKSMIMAWRKALKWTDGLDCALSVMLASVASTKSIGDQLWVKIIGPASCGKSTLCEAISINPRYIIPKSTIRGFHTGYKDPSGEDHSLIAKVSGKTLMTKDGDTLLQSPNLGQILSEARDVYDSVSRTHYRNSQSNDYTGIRMTWVLCGTSSLRSIDSSELGERFLDCVLMDEIDDDLEDAILWRKANQVNRNVHIEADGKPETQYDPELVLAMQLTGGYVDYLRQNATELLSAVAMDDAALRKCTRLGKLVAHLRARPSKLQDETAEREFAARLVSQLVRLAKCLAIVLNRPEVDSEVMRRVIKVAFDTSRGQTAKIVAALYESETGLTSNSLSLYCNQTEGDTRKLLRFLRQIKVVQMNTVKAENGARTSQNRWALTERLRTLYQEVVSEQAD